MDRPVNSYLIENMAQEFWEMADGADGTSKLPRDIKTAITLALPLEVYSVPALRVNHVLPGRGASRLLIASVGKIAACMDACWPTGGKA